MKQYELMKNISLGDLRPELENEACRRHGVRPVFRKLFKQCVRFQPRERPSMQDVVRRLEKIIQDAEAARAKFCTSSRPKNLSDTLRSLSSPWSVSQKVTAAVESFSSRFTDPELQPKLVELRKLVDADLGPEVTEPLAGVYSATNLLRFLRMCENDVNDARTQVVLNSNARLEFKMDAKREHIVCDDLSFDTLPVSFI